MTQEKLKELFSYDEKSGIFKRSKTGDLVGYTQTGGYIRFRIMGKSYLAHRLVWMYVHGEFPINNIDHINGITSDNRLCNLREATNSENSQNIRSFSVKNKSGFPGVSWSKHAKKWRAKIKLNGKCITIGYFHLAEEAGNAYLKKKTEIHPYFMIDNK